MNAYCIQSLHKPYNINNKFLPSYTPAVFFIFTTFEFNHGR